MISSNKKLIVIGGPTASGKTALSIRLARHHDTAILSADSRQCYREMRIGTARPSEEELAAAPHYFIADRSVTEPLSAGQYEREALALLDDLFRKKDVVIVSGGTGLYIKALTEGLDEFPEVPVEIREQVEEIYRQGGLPALQSEVATRDPGYFAEVDAHNPARLKRALAVCLAGGLPYSAYRRSAPIERPFTAEYYYIDWPRPALYARIDARVDQMMAEGLLAEARALYPLRHLPPLQTVGYQELFDHFEGKHDLDTAVELIKRNSRRYAKRQLTWLRRDGYWRGVAP